jgi:1-pyrroline-5-carboxylate dehydrogenase
MTPFAGVRRVPAPINEPVRTYAPGSPERHAIKARLASMASERVDIPLIIGGEEIRTGTVKPAVMPHDYRHVLADWHCATQAHVTQAIEAAT